MLSAPEREMISSSLEFGFGGSESFVLPVSPIKSMLSVPERGMISSFESSGLSPSFFSHVATGLASNTTLDSYY